MNLSLLNLVQWYTDFFTTQLPTWSGFATIYAWLAVASLVTVVVAFVSMIFKREAGGSTAVLVGQHVLVYAVPYLLASFVPAGTAALQGGGFV